ncbi:NAD-dependent epimerase/dehydratase family protein [Algoriphagus namhaensis]
MKVALLSGTSGLIGMQLLHQLLKNTAYDYVISVGRRELALKHRKLIQIQGDIAQIESWDWAHKLVERDLGGELQQLKLSLESKDCQVDSYCALGTTIGQAGSKEKFKAIDHDLVLALARWSKSLGADQFLYVSALGADPESSVFYNQVKGQVEESLKSVGFTYLGLFRPSLLMGERKEFRLGEQIATIAMKPLVWLKIMKNIRPIYDYQVARSMVIRALAPNKTAQVEYVNSGQMQDLTA